MSSGKWRPFCLSLNVVITSKQELTSALILATLCRLLTSVSGSSTSGCCSTLDGVLCVFLSFSSLLTTLPGGPSSSSMGAGATLRLEAELLRLGNLPKFGFIISFSDILIWSIFDIFLGVWRPFSIVLGTPHCPVIQLFSPNCHGYWKFGVSIYKAVRRPATRTRKISKPWDMGLLLHDRSPIWQASRQFLSNCKAQRSHNQFDLVEHNPYCFP